jgi:4-hydroxy-4-methyl-2-oxoglutarate aldolase
VTPVDPALLDALRAYDTPTLANALDGLTDRPANTGYTRPPVCCVLPNLHAMVGYAVTMTIRSETPFADATESMQQLYDAVARVEGPTSRSRAAVHQGTSKLLMM